MSRYIGATCRISRRYKQDLDFKTRDIESKCRFSSAPGQHGQKKRKGSDYAQQLAAKQMLRFKYGLTERTFRNLYQEATRVKGVTGTLLLQFLESRLDNIVYRMGFAPTRRQARQSVSHRHIMVNGRCVNIPSYRVKVGDVISVKAKAQQHVRVLESIQNAESRESSDWMEVNLKDFSGVFKRLPERSDLPSDINEQLVIEFYSK
ncbi:MAG: 30S ribosomal protein S4 [Pseudomonadota bacterium]